MRTLGGGGGLSGGRDGSVTQQAARRKCISLSVIAWSSPVPTVNSAPPSHKLQGALRNARRMHACPEWGGSISERKNGAAVAAGKTVLLVGSASEGGGAGQAADGEELTCNRVIWSCIAAVWGVARRASGGGGSGEVAGVCSTTLYCQGPLAHSSTCCCGAKAPAATG